MSRGMHASAKPGGQWQVRQQHSGLPYLDTAVVTG